MLVNLFYVIDLMLLLEFHIHKKTSIFVMKQENQSFLLHKTNNLSRLIFILIFLFDAISCF